MLFNFSYLAIKMILKIFNDQEVGSNLNAANASMGNELPITFCTGSSPEFSFTFHFSIFVFLTKYFKFGLKDYLIMICNFFCCVLVIH